VPPRLRTENAVREAVLKLLSEQEYARLSAAEPVVRLQDGDEYLELEHPSYGVRRSSGATTVIGSVLQRRAVRESTWSRILLQVAGGPPRRGPTGG
jgi:hypothetical protein